MEYQLLIAIAVCAMCTIYTHGQTEAENNEIIEIVLTTATPEEAPTSSSAPAQAPVSQAPLRPGQVLVQRIQNITAAAAAAAKPIRDVLPKCECSALTCECCVRFGIQQNFDRSACARMNANFNDWGLILDLVVDGNVINTNSITPQNFPMCASYPPIGVCFVVENIYSKNDSFTICPKLEVKVFTATMYNGDLPCPGWKNGTFGMYERPEQ